MFSANHLQVKYIFNSKMFNSTISSTGKLFTFWVAGQYPGKNSWIKKVNYSLK